MKLSKFPKFLFFYSILILNLAISAFQIYSIIGNFFGKKLGLMSFYIEFYKNINPLFQLGYINSEFIVILSSLLLVSFIESINNKIINIIYSDKALEKSLNSLKQKKDQNNLYFHQEKKRSHQYLERKAELESEELIQYLEYSKRKAELESDELRFKEECKKVKKSKISELIFNSLKSALIASIILTPITVFF